MGTQWGFFYDQSRCIGCRACELACKNWNDARRGDAKINVDDVSRFQELYYTPQNSADKASNYIDPNTGATNYGESRKYYMKENWRRVTRHPYGTLTKDSAGRFVSSYDVRNLSLGCNHCDSPACMQACPTGRIYKEDEYGAVLINVNAPCDSCGECKKACPYDAPQFYDDPARYPADAAQKPLMTKCTLCIDRIGEGLKPACVAGCMLRALDAGPVSELMAAHPGASYRILDEMPASATGPNVLFNPKPLKTKA